MAWTLAVAAITLLAPQKPEEPQNSAPNDEPQILRSNEVRSLNSKAQAWFEAWIGYEFESDDNRARLRQSKRLQSAKDAFLKEWEVRNRRADLLASLPDLRAIFANVFPYGSQTTSGGLKQTRGEEGLPDYGLVAPRGYDEKRSYRCILSLPTFDAEQQKWTNAKSHYDATWNGSALAEETIFVIPEPPAATDLETFPAPDNVVDEEAEKQRNLLLLGTLGVVQRAFNLDRNQLFLDAGKGSMGYVLRVASYFPERFAGVVVRHASELSPRMRLGSLTGMPILILDDGQNPHAKALAEKLQALEGGAVTVLATEAGDTYPFAQSRAGIEEWIAQTSRVLNRRHIVIEPNSDSWKSGYWVRLGTTSPLGSTPDDKKPRLVLDADREANRITVQAVGIMGFRLLLNDEIVDLGQPFTVVVNGKAFKEERGRSLQFLTESMMQQFDPNYVFTAEFATSVGD